MGKLFGTDGIRGVANRYPMTAEMALTLGRAVAHFFQKPGHRPQIILGRDTRLSGDMLESALVAGICSQGAQAIRVGVLPTPGVAFLSRAWEADAGIVISASHNPFEDNGFKIFDHGGNKLTPEQEAAIEDLLFSQQEQALIASPEEVGRADRRDDAAPQYIAFLKRAFPPNVSLQDTRVVLDCAHGATVQVAPETFRQLGAQVGVIFNEPDGKNINRQCGSQHLERLAQTVVDQRAAVGFAFDGDGDRMLAVDERGTALTGDQMLAICAAFLKKEGRLQNNLVVRTVMSNIGLTSAFRGLGIDSVMTNVGDREVLQEMLARGAMLGGEDSGHLIFLEHHTTGDGIITALQLLAVMKKEGKPLSELAKIMQVFPQTLINVEVKRRADTAEVPEVVKIIREVEQKLGPEGRVLVRYSGTQNICRVMVEGPTAELTEAYCREVAAVVQERLA